MSDGELRQTMKRLMSIHDEIDEKKLDLKTVYADAKSAGYDKTALGLAIRQIRSREKNETPAAQERSAIVELYVSAFDNAPRTYVHVPAREASHEPMPHREHAPATQDGHDVDRGASAQPHSAIGGPAIPSKAGDAGTGQAVCDEAAMAALGQPSGAGTGSAVRTGAPVSNTSLGPLTAAQSEGSAGANPEEAAPASATESEVVTPQAQGAQFVTPTGEGEGAAPPVDPSPAADEPIKGLAAANAIAAKAASLVSAQPRRSPDEGMPDIPAFLRRSRDSHQSMGEQA